MGTWIQSACVSAFLAWSTACGGDDTAACVGPACLASCEPGCDLGEYCSDTNVCVPGCETAADCGTAACVNHDCQDALGQGVDILFVVDNSGSMQEEQAALASQLPTLINVLQTASGGLPDVHIGVISTDMGAGPYTIASCLGSGDNGSLQLGVAGCPAVNGSYISDVASGGGARTTNYTGNLADALGCMVQLGVTGCGFEQPIGSLRRALTSGALAGFRRPSAALAIAFVGDEDDCSASDTAVFDPSNTELGPLSSFRCFEYGVTCAPDQPRTTGAKLACAVRTDSPYLLDPAEVIEAITGVAPASLVAVAVIAGNPSPVEVGPDPFTPANPSLLASCTSANGEAAPGIRLDALAAAFPDTSVTSSICASFQDPMASFGAQIVALLP